MEPPKPPRTPRTAAGTEIVESVLAAAERVIDEHGLAGFTTNHVAERAGVSVGSLYQYFPNKEAILAELARRLERRTQHQIVAILASAGDAPLPVVVGQIVDAMRGQLGGLAYRRALLAAVPDAWVEATSREVDAEVRDRVRAALAARSDLRAGDPVLMAWVVAHAIEGLFEAAIRTDPSLVESPAFRAELIVLVTQYLSAGEP